MSDSETLFQFIADALKRVDDGAIPLGDGTPTGLWWYHRHLQADGPAPGSYRNEEKFFAALANVMEERCVVVPEQPYIGTKRTASGKRCDLTFEWPGLGRTWMEVKGAWRHADRYGNDRNPAYRKHLYSAADDVEKLLSAPRDRADAIAFLLVGFDHLRDPIPDGDIDIVRRAAVDPSWSEQSISWSDRRPNDGRVRVWIWVRRLAV